MKKVTSLTAVLKKFPSVSTKEALHMLSKVDPYLWVATHRRLRGHPLLYDVRHILDKNGGPQAPKHMLLRHRPFLIQPLTDQHPHKVYKKARQMGVSELAINEELCFLDSNPGTKWIRTFPRDSQLKDFSVTRINEALDETNAMRALVGVPNQVYTKRIGDSYLILRSAWESNLGEGVDADGVSLDEKDRMKDGVEIAFRESLASSRFAHLREISTPTLPGRGVDEPYQKSCQYEWFVRCMKCGARQPIKYPDNVIQMKDVRLGAKQLEPGTYVYKCFKEKCRGDLDRLSGEWVAKYPSNTHIAGYLMPQTLAPWITATELMQKKIDYRFLQLWMNYCVGECSMGEKILLSDEDFYKCLAGHQWYTSRTREWSRIVAGIDWGQRNWCVVIGVNAFNDLPYLIGFAFFDDDDRDPLGSARKMDEFLQPFDPDCIVADAGYGKDRNAYLLKRWDYKFFACLSSMTKVATLDAAGWKYMKDVKVGDWTYAWDGERCVPTRITAVHKNGRRKVVRVVVKNGNGRKKTIVCTSDHVFPLRLGGEKEAGDLQPGDRLVPFGRWKTANGYRVMNPTNTSKHLAYEHRVVFPVAEVVHHVDGNPINNSPENLEGMTRKGHRKKHPLEMSRYPKFMRTLRKRNKANKKRYMEQTHTPEANAKRVATRKKRGWYKKDRKENHVVVSVTPAGSDLVMDLTVEHPAHNFALHDSVFVHNCYYNPSDKHSRTFKPQFVETSNRVLADRTIALKEACRVFRDKEIGLPRFDDRIRILIEHFKSLAPLQIEEDGTVYEVIDKTGDDHLAHCMAYALMAFEYVTAGWRRFNFSWE